MITIAAMLVAGTIGTTTTYMLKPVDPPVTGTAHFAHWDDCPEPETLWSDPNGIIVDHDVFRIKPRPFNVHWAPEEYTVHDGNGTTLSLTPPLQFRVKERTR